MGQRSVLISAPEPEVDTMTAPGGPLLNQANLILGVQSGDHGQGDMYRGEGDSEWEDGERMREGNNELRGVKRETMTAHFLGRASRWWISSLIHEPIQHIALWIALS